MSTSPIPRVLFLCTGNSARSILAECLLRDRGAGRFESLSAGSQPKAAPHPAALELLAERGHAIEGLRSKSWDEFSGPAVPPIDFVFTVCGNAAAETCPAWPGHPATAHWGIEDPAAVEGPPEAVRAAFAAAYEAMDARITSFLALPMDELPPPALAERLRAIGTRGK